MLRATNTKDSVVHRRDKSRVRARLLAAPTWLDCGGFDVENSSGQACGPEEDRTARSTTGAALTTCDRASTGRGGKPAPLHDRSFTNPLPGSWGIRRSVEKKPNFSEGDGLERIEDITYSVFERFSIFQFIGKNPKINNFFFDEKSSKTFRASKIF